MCHLIGKNECVGPARDSVTARVDRSGLLALLPFSLSDLLQCTDLSICSCSFYPYALFSPLALKRHALTSEFGNRGVFALKV